MRHLVPSRLWQRLHGRAALRWTLVGGLVVTGVLATPGDLLVPVLEEPPRPGHLRFISLNLRHGGIFSELLGDDEALESRLRMVVDGLRRLDADVVGLQEASTGPRRGNVAARLAAALGYEYVYAPAATRPFGSEHVRRAVASVLGFTEGPAVLSRFPILDWTAHQLPRCGTPFEARVLLFAELDTPVGRLPVFSAHISAEPCQARAVVDLVEARRGPLPAVVMGDFNAGEGSPVVRTITRDAGWVDAFRQTNPGMPGPTAGQKLDAARATADERIDYVFLVPGRAVPGRVVTSRVVLDTPRQSSEIRWPSDHYGVLADVAVEGAASVSAAARRPRPRSRARR